jgi:hypothetical protein
VLNRAEWIKYLAPFFNKEDVANSVFASISTVRLDAAIGLPGMPPY